MTSARDDRKTGKTDKSGGREQRLAAALRDNLRRRKAQARGRDKAAGSGPSAAGSSESGEAEASDR